jgi:serine/threonine-protein kinase
LKISEQMEKIKLPEGIYEYDPAKPLGKAGGFGQVFAGRTSKGEEVAIKIIHVSVADASHREMRIVDELKKRPSEHVIPFIDGGEDADSGRFFVVMPKAERSLQSVIDKNGLFAAPDASSILLQIAKGLGEVGDLVHRDLKPDNVLYHDGKWKIADFGIARFVEEVTASNTLKEWKSPEYAAPEQWRSERATHQTDIYALGCIGYCLLTGKPPFTNNPSEEHQKAEVPEFKCEDFRLKRVITMMLRKPPEVRGTLSRVQERLTAILEKPQQDDFSDSFSTLATIDAKLVEEKHRQEAQQEAERQSREKRNQMALSAYGILWENIEHLWGKIHNQSEIATRNIRNDGVEIHFGGALFVFRHHNHGSAYEQKHLHHSGWDLLSWAEYHVYQSGAGLQWGASLFYAKQKVHEDYRWVEVPVFMLGTNAIVAIDRLELADYALSSLQNFRIAYGPWIIDDEKEDEFHSRVVWLMTQAAKGELKMPRSLPFQMWPPPMR